MMSDDVRTKSRNKEQRQRSTSFRLNSILMIPLGIRKRPQQHKSKSLLPRHFSMYIFSSHINYFIARFIVSKLQTIPTFILIPSGTSMFREILSDTLLVRPTFQSDRLKDLIMQYAPNCYRIQLQSDVPSVESSFFGRCVLVPVPTCR